ncbi:MAG: GNAT family N-acetyltransferase [Actinomycetota bacterium]|nr:GNAT family N-acetyltransferase [Actinomycetota bacterium]
MDGSVLGIEVREATVRDVPELADVLARAFADGPITIWHVPDDQQRADVMCRFFAAGLEHVFLRHGEVYTTAGEMAGCCIWMPPGAESIRDDRTALFEDACERIFRGFPRTFELFAIMEEIHPTEPSYYLPFVGVDPKRQGRGVGAAMLAPVLAKCDREEILAYLEADDRSRPFHERNGFKVIREVRLPNGPSLWPMERHPSPNRAAD